MVSVERDSYDFHRAKKDVPNKADIAEAWFIDAVNKINSIN